MMTSVFKFEIYYTKKEELIKCLQDMIEQVKEEIEDGGVQICEGRAVASFTTDQTEEPIEKIKEKFDEVEIDEDEEEEDEEED